MSPVLPTTEESKRLRTLRALRLLDQPGDATLDALVRSASRALACPIAAINLVDEQHQCSKAIVGADAFDGPRATSFCAHTIAGDSWLSVADASADARFAHNPLVVGSPGIRAYAGWPLVVDGACVGALCVIDTRPRQFGDDDARALHDLARAVEHWFAARLEHLALRERERELRRLAEQVPGVVYRAALDETCSTLYVSPRLREFGHDPQHWMARPGAWIDALHPDDRPRVVAELHAALAAGSDVQLEYRLADGAGHWRHVRDIARLSGARDDEATVLQGVMIDISAEVESRLLQRLLQTAVEQTTQAVIVTDPDARILWVNRAACEMTGYATDELVGANPRLLQSGRTPLAVHVALWRALVAGETWTGLMLNRRKDGSDYAAYAAIQPVRDDAGRTTHYLAVVQDVTEQRRLNVELERFRTQLDQLVAQRTAELDRARESAEAASAAKSTFLATMSHEIRTPMNGVIGMVDLLQQSSLTPYQRELVDTITESGTLLLALIDDILDFSKIEAGRLELDVQPFDPLALVEGAVDALRPLATRRDVALHMYVDPALPSRLAGDALRVRQIVNNLLGNAIKFSAGLDRPGRVSVRALRGADGGFELVVADNGIGIAPSAQARLFRPFEQGKSSRAYGGSGLGLAISHRLVDAMGGRIHVHSQEGQGSRFEVRLPLRATAPATAPAWNLAGLRCVLRCDDAERAADWGAWLAAAGAGVDAGRTVYLVDAALVTGSEVDPDAAPTVVLERGRRREPRVEGVGRVRLDADAVHRDTLLHAVALAAGRATSTAAAAPPSTDEDPPLPDATQAARQGRLVLVAEDNPINRLVIEHQLRRLGLACCVAGDGAEALAQWRAHPERYGLLLTDLEMPQLDGYALTAAIRADEAARGGRRLAIVALTAHALPGEGARCRAADMDDHLVKPVRSATLRAAAQRWLPPAPRQPSADAAGLQLGLPLRAPAPAVVVVDDDPLQRQLFERQLATLQAGAAEFYGSARAALRRLRGKDTAATLLLLDLNLPGMDGIELMRSLVQNGYAGAVALVSGADPRVIESASRLARASRLRVVGELRKPVATDELRRLLWLWQRGATPAREQRAGCRPLAEVQRALDRGELRVYYQPQVTLAEGQLVGVEALVRWQHPADGLLGPDVFVPVIEASGLSDRLTSFVLDEALAQCRRWRDADGLALRVSVNVAMDSLARLDFPDLVFARLRAHGLASGDLALEVTETGPMRDRRSTLETLSRLRLHGVVLAVDDFGTGYATLAQLRDLPFGEFKVDRSFVHGAQHDATLRPILRGIVGMARRLGLQVVAEGVEDEADWHCVRKAGCHLAQGWHIARAMPADELPAWQRRWRAPATPAR
jgi:PAS domain S-box-containing protein